MYTPNVFVYYYLLIPPERLCKPENKTQGRKSELWAENLKLGPVYGIRIHIWREREWGRGGGRPTDDDMDKSKYG